MKQILIFILALWGTCGLLAQNNVITYMAPDKLSIDSRHFNTSISSHTFSNGEGTITFSSPLTSIGDSAFYECGLVSITLPNSVTSIGDYAFSFCFGLTSITLPNSVTSIGDDAFLECGFTSITLPSSLTSIGDGAFSLCLGLISIMIPDSVTSIGDWAFSYCESLVSVTLPNSLTSIGDYAFDECFSLTSITLPNSLKGIGDGAFRFCESLVSVTLPNSLTSIGKQAFAYTDRLTSIQVDASNPKYDSRNNCNAIIETSSNTLIVGCQNTVIPNSVTSIGDGAFYACRLLTSITLPNSVTSIGDYAFSFCFGLTSITLPNSVTSIGDGAFYACRLLTSITLPNSLKGIGDGAFRRCESLVSVTLPNSLTSIGKQAFAYTDRLTSIQVDASNPKYDSRNNCNAIIETSSNTLIAGCQNTVIPNTVTSIGDWAFYECQFESRVFIIPNSVTSIGDSAFYAATLMGCWPEDSIVLHIYVYADVPPTVGKSAYLCHGNWHSEYWHSIFVPCDRLQAYRNDQSWGSGVSCIESEEVDNAIWAATPSDNDVTITWPKNDNASSYSLEITKGGALFCTLTFNAQGQLMNIAFAPGMNRDQPQLAAEETSTGFKFTVRGLEPNQKYDYSFKAKDSWGSTLKTYTGEFTTKVKTAVDHVSGTTDENVQKIIENGQLIMIRDGVRYNVQGIIVD